LSTGLGRQERLLARRFVSLGTHEISWECDSLLECECFTVHGYELDSQPFSDRAIAPVHRKYNLRRKLEQEITNKQLFDAWRRNIVQPYTERELTMSSDRLVALSAIAFEFSKRLSDQYLAGIWREDLQRGLLCHCNETSSVFEIGLSSWSWASVQGRISWPRRQKLDPAVCPKVVRVEYAISPDNLFGRPHAASITLRAKVMHKAQLILYPVPALEGSRGSTYKLRLSRAKVF
jgi:hypothetical protein